MKNILVMSLVLMTTSTYGQLKNEDLAINKFKVEKKLKCIADDPVNKAVLDMDLKTSIVTTFKTGNEKLVAAYFSLNVDISVLDKENLYSKSQAEQVLKTFFLENKPVSFTLSHEGSYGSYGPSMYYVGALSTSKEKYRVTINVKLVEGKEEISQLTIQKEG